MSPGEDGGKKLFDDFVLSDHHFLQLLLHYTAMLAEFLEDVSQIALFACHDLPFCLVDRIDHPTDNVALE